MRFTLLALISLTVLSVQATKYGNWDEVWGNAPADAVLTGPANVDEFGMPLEKK